MSYKIVVDSCCELPEYFKKSTSYESVPLTIQVDDYHIIDDETFDQADLLAKVKKSPNCPKSSCPSPERYMQAYKGEEENIYVVTLSAELSGSYNSAMLAKNLFMEENEKKNIHVFNSQSASGGETHIALLAKEYEEQNMSFEDIVKKIESFIADMKTYFVLESLEALRKNGRLSGVKALIASTLNIKPLMSSTKGSIIQLGQARGINKALSKLIETALDEVKDTEKRMLIITHCNCSERAKSVLEEFLSKAQFKGSLIMDTAGISSLYASDGGIIVTL